MANTIKIKRGLKANLSKANLQPGEMAFATDTKELYVSDTTAPINANTTYSISKSGSIITLTGSDGSTSTVSDSNTTYSAATTAKDGLMSVADKTKLNGIATGAEVNQNAFSNVVIGSTTIAADAKTDTLTVVAGSNITLTPDATNDKITIAATDTTYGNATTSAAGLMTAAMVTKLNGIATGATKTTVDTSLSSSSTNPVQNKVIYNALAGKAATSAIPTKTSQLTNDSDYATKEYVNELAGNAGMTYQVVTEFPEEASSNVIYLIANTNTGNNNTYDEYMWINDTWEFIGNTETDLSQYATKDSVDNQINLVNQKLDTNIADNEAEFNAIDANMVNLTEQISDLRSLINVGGVSGLENATVSIDDNKLQVGSDDSAAQVKSDGNTFEILTNGEISVKADGEKLYANNISTNGYIDAGAHRQQIFEINGEIRTGWFYTGGTE